MKGKNAGRFSTEWRHAYLIDLHHHGNGGLGWTSTRPYVRREKTIRERQDASNRCRRRSPQPSLPQLSFLSSKE